MEKYKVTRKVVYCDARCTRIGGRGIFDCLCCDKRTGYFGDETTIMSKERYVALLKCGNVYITNVEKVE